MSGRVPLAEKALSEGYARLRYRDTSLLIWQQQQQKLASVPPGTYKPQTDKNMSINKLIWLMVVLGSSLFC